MPGHVKAEIAAVRALTDGIARYAERIRSVAAAAATTARRTEATMQQIAEQRLHELNRATRELERAQAAVAGCKRNCGPLVAAAARAQQAQQRAEASHRRAVQAERIVRTASHELHAAIAAADSTIGNHSPAAIGALTDLEQRLQEITGTSHIVLGERAAEGISLTISIAREGSQPETPLPDSVPLGAYGPPQPEAGPAAAPRIAQPDAGPPAIEPPTARADERGQADENSQAEQTPCSVGEDPAGPASPAVPAIPVHPTTANQIEMVLAEVMAFITPQERFEEYLRHIWLLLYDEPGLRDTQPEGTSPGTSPLARFCGLVAADSTPFLVEAQVAGSVRQDVDPDDLYQLTWELGTSTGNPSRSDYKQRIEDILSGLRTTLGS